MSNKITPKVVFVSVAIALFLWASFNMLDLLVTTYTNNESSMLFMAYGLTQLFSLIILVYYGAYGKIFQK